MDQVGLIAITVLVTMLGERGLPALYKWAQASFERRRDRRQSIEERLLENERWTMAQEELTRRYAEAIGRRYTMTTADGETIDVETVGVVDGNAYGVGPIMRMRPIDPQPTEEVEFSGPEFALRNIDRALHDRLNPPTVRPVGFTLVVDVKDSAD